MVGRIFWFSSIRIVAAASMAPEADSVWPIIDLVEETGSSLILWAKTAASAMWSILSFSGFPVPWALTYSIWSGWRPASAMALDMQAMIALPSGLDLVR